jgi:hypothetical protein
MSDKKEFSYDYTKFLIMEAIGDGYDLPLKVGKLSDSTVNFELNVLFEMKYVLLKNKKYFQTTLGKEFFEWMKERIAQLDKKSGQAKSLMEESEGKKKKEVETYDGKQFLKLELPEPVFQIEGIILDRSITILAGYQSTFKTHLCSYLGLCVINGAKLFDKLACRKDKVLYINEELHPGAFQKLLKQLSKGTGLDVTNDITVMNFQNLKIDSDEDNKKYLKLITDKKIKLVIFDTFRECFNAAENSADEIMRVLANYVRPIIEKTGCSFLIIMHKGKAGVGTDSRQPVDLIRGSSVFRNYVDSIILIERVRKTERVELSHEKIRTAKELDNFSIVWKFGNGSIEPKMMSEEDIEKLLIDDCKKELIDFLKKSYLIQFKTGEKTPIHKKFIESKKYSRGSFYSGLKELIEDGKLRQIKRGLYEVVGGGLNDFS